MNVFEKLYSKCPDWNYVTNTLLKDYDKIYLSTTLKNCFDYLDSDSSVDENDCKYMCSCLYAKQWEELNTGHWSLVTTKSRQIYTLLSYLQALFALKESISEENIRKSLSFIDYGLLLGAPLNNTNEYPKANDLMQDAGTILNSALYIPSGSTETSQTNETENLILVEEILYIPPLHNNTVSIVDRPSLEHFRDNYFKPKLPVLLSNCLNHWPALKNWKNIDYLLKASGERLIPVEIGKNYTKDDWSQGLMSFKKFILEQMSENSKNPKKIKYLAQHNLFDQIPELRRDISIPDYCALSNEEDSVIEPDIKSWFGPKGTISPLHYDNKSNLLCQVLGYKKVILVSPEDTPNIYPHDSFLLNNTSEIDAENLDFIKFPLVKNVKFYELILKNEMMLFIPQGWWHYVTSLSNSFSVSFWWN